VISIFTPHVFKSPTPVLYVSPHNAGAAAVAEVLIRATTGLSVVNEPPPSWIFRGSEEPSNPALIRHLGRQTSHGSRHTLMRRLGTQGGQTSGRQLDEHAMASQRSSHADARRTTPSTDQRSSRRTPSAHASTDSGRSALPPREHMGDLATATHVLLYLNHDTFSSASGVSLAHEVRLALRLKLRVLLVHETRPQHGGCPFDRFFHVTPDDLVCPPHHLYQRVAVPLHAHRRHLAVALSQLAAAMGPLLKPSAANRASTDSSRRRREASPFDVAAGVGKGAVEWAGARALLRFGALRDTAGRRGRFEPDFESGRLTSSPHAHRALGDDVNAMSASVSIDDVHADAQDMEAMVVPPVASDEAQEGPTSGGGETRPGPS